MSIKLPAIPLIAVAASLLAACTWVEPTEEGYAVALAKPEAVQNCDSLGTATAKVRDKVGVMTRKEDKVRKELITLGKNEAANMGGDTITPIGSIENGQQKFRVYRCIPQ